MARATRTVKTCASRAALRWVGFVAILAASTTGAVASSSQSWVLRNRDDFKDVKLDGVALSPDGSFRLSAKVTRLLDPAQPNLWCLARDAKGRIYAGGGNEGKVFRIDPAAGGGSSQPEVVFDSQELEVHALAFDAGGRLHAATSPRGAVYMIDDHGMSTVIFDPEETYIWAIAFDGRGRLYAATGQRGRVYRVDRPGPNASGEVVLDGKEDHIRSLAAAPDGSLFAGSDQNGIIYRISPDGAASVVYDSPMREIAALSVAGDQIYAATLAPLARQRTATAPPAGGGVTRVRVTAEDSGGETEAPPQGGEEDQDQSQQRRQGARPPALESYYGAIYKVTRDGYARKLWESKEALPLSLAPFEDGKLLVGTGNEGLVILLDDSGDATDFVSVESQQVNALLADARDGFFAAASNLGQVVRISPSAAQTGRVTSQPHDAGFTSSWGTLAWSADVPPGASVVFRTRTGNTEEPDDSWSDWSSQQTVPGETPIDRPKARYLQWEASLRAGRGGESPVLRNIQIGYLQDNLPPELTEVEVLAPGVVLTGLGPGGGSDRGGETEANPAARRAQNQPRRSFEKGKRSVIWKSEDANNDMLRYDVFFKAEDETLWKPLARDLEEEFYTWDATAMPDGVYRIQAAATDAPSNPPGTALSGSRVSGAFDVDNTPPVVGPVEARSRSRSAEVTVTVTDSFSVIGEVAYSLDAAEWIPVLPEDRIADSMKESYRLRTAELEPGEHTVTVRAKDRAGNAAAGKVIIRVE